ncbi:MAG: hypothetical protein ACKV0T_20260 [Planctomycetales bacterium]
MTVQVDPGSSHRLNSPVGVEIDFGKLFQAAGIAGRLDRHSIRVVRVDPAFGRAIQQEGSGDRFEIPH